MGTIQDQQPKTILLVEDEPLIAMATAQKITHFGYEVMTAHTGEQAVEIATENPVVSLILMDIDLGDGIDGTEAAQQILAVRHLPIVFLTSHMEEEYVSKVKQTTRYGYIIKNSGDFVLNSSIEMACELFKEHENTRKNEAFLNAVGKMAKVGGWEVDGETLQVSWTEATYSIHEMPLEYTPPVEDAINFFHPLDRKTLTEAIHKALNHGEPYDMELRFMTAKGKDLWVRTICQPDKKRGTAGHFLRGTIQDITEQKKAEEALKESETRLRAIGDNFPAGQLYQLRMESDTPPRFTYVSAKVQELHECTPDEAMNDSSLLFNRVVQDDVPAWNETLLRTIADNYPNSYISIIEEDLTIGFTSGKEFKKWGLKPEDFIGLQLKDIFGEFTPTVKEHYLKTFDGEEVTFELFINNQYQLYNTVPLCDENSEIHQILVVVENITERKKAEQAVKESERKFRTLFENSQAAIIFFDADYNVVMLNETNAELLGGKREEFIGKSIYDLFPDMANFHVERFKNVTASGKAALFEDEFPLPNGTKWFSSLLQPIFKNQEQFEGIQIIAIDITEKKNAEHAFVKNQTILQNAEEISDIGSYEMDIRTGELTFSDGWLRIHGCTHKTMTMEELLPIAHPEDIPKIEKAFDDAIHNITPYHLEHRIIRQNDGEIRTIRASSKMVCDEHGQPLKLYGAVQDITERKKAEQALQTSEERFDLAMNASQDGLFDWDLVTNAIYYSPGWKNMLGYEEHELPNDFSIWEQLTEAEDVKRSWDMQQELIHKKRERFEMEFKMKHKKGHWVDILSRASAIFDEYGQAVRIVGTHVDITERRQAEEALMQAKEALQEANDTKDTFFSIIAHDLKNPLLGFQSGTELLVDHLKDSENESLRFIATELHKRAHHVSALLDKLLTWARMQQGALPYHPEPLELAGVVQHTVNLLRDQAAHKQIAVTCMIAQGAMVLADILMVETVVRNLLSNAIKFTHEGGTITIESQDAGEFLEIAFNDNGVGMTDEQQHKLFRVGEKQITRRGTEGETGTGLGLILCKEFVEKHGGEIRVDSDVGTGSTFTFTLPKTEPDVHSGRERVA